jgi:hypothetical protein
MCYVSAFQIKFLYLNKARTDAHCRQKHRRWLLRHTEVAALQQLASASLLQERLRHQVVARVGVFNSQEGIHAFTYEVFVFHTVLIDIFITTSWFHMF